MTIERSARLTLWLAVAELALPFIWMKIGPNGHAYYGPDVPDIYILGATVLGKDLNALSLAIGFQLVMGLCFIICACLVIGKLNKGHAVRGIAMFQMALLLLFPCWLRIYVQGVINNSDGAASDLRVFPHVGLVVYGVLLLLVINTVVKAGFSGVKRDHASADETRPLPHERQIR